MTIKDRILFLAVGFLSAYLVVVEIGNATTIAIISYTISFGMILVASLLLVIFGFGSMESQLVVLISTLIPLSLSLGLVWEYLVLYRFWYLLFVVVGFLAIFISQINKPGNNKDKGKVTIIIITIVHGVAGLIIFLLPVVLSFSGIERWGFSILGAGGAIMGIGGLFLSFLRMGRPILSRETVLRLFPILLFITTAAFVTGFAFK